MKFDPFRNFPAFQYLGDGGQWHTRNASDMRPDLTSYSVCLGCAQPLAEPREHRTGLHDRCEPGYRVEARFIWPGEEWSLDRVGRFVCGGCGGFFIAHMKDTEAEFKRRVTAWVERHGGHAPKRAT